MKILIKKFCLLLLTFAIYANVKAQNSKVLQDSLTARNIAQKWGVNKQKAKQIVAALKYHNDELNAMIKNERMSPNDKRATIKRIMLKRKQLLDSLLTPSQKAGMMKVEDENLEKSKARMADFKKKHQMDLDRMKRKMKD